jgi:CMP-N-acetylneuraminic acid synthetase/SAM-dependent methyltransferase
MICALLIGRDGSTGFPGKNLYPVLGRPMAYYPMRIALSCKNIDRLYVSTDSDKISDLAIKCGAELITRPSHLASSSALGEDAFVHGVKQIKNKLNTEGKKIELIVLLFANAVTFTPTKIDEGISALRKNLGYDSAISVSSYNMWSPLRARKINNDGMLEPFIPFENFGNPETLTCDRDSQGDVWYADMGFSIVRPHCIENIKSGLLPQKWMGKSIYPIKQWGGLDVDEPWQIPIVESWLEAHEINNLFKLKRLKWNQLYDSERTVLSKLSIKKYDKVLDIGHEPGALSIILKEKYSITDYSAVENDYEKAREALAINPDAKIINKSLKKYLEINNEIELYNIIFGLHINDRLDYFDKIVEKAYSLLKPGGYLVGTCRLTDGTTINSVEKSNQKIVSNDQEIVPYVINNAQDVIQKLRGINPAEIIIFGYSGRPSSTASTPLKIVTFAVFAVRKQVRGGFQTKENIELPDNVFEYISIDNEIDLPMSIEKA